MRMVVNYRSEILVIGKTAYPLNDFKQFLIRYYSPLVEKQFIKAIWQKGYFTETVTYFNGSTWVSDTTIYRTGRIVFTYDWFEIIKRCERSVKPVFDFITYINRKECSYIN